MDLSEQVAFYQARAPLCLSGFKVASTGTPAIALDGHGEPVNSFFSLKCAKCGGGEQAVVGHNHHTEWGGKQIVVLVSPIALRCIQCRASTPLFDTDRHGYDAELNGHGTHYRAQGSAVEFVCSCGQGKSFAPLTARFEYPGDVVDAPEEYEGKAPENLFSWFTLTGDCTQCRQTLQIADFECA